MSITQFNRFNQAIVSIYEIDEEGHIKPNTLFHRPIDKLHSRCIEYPFAASRLGCANIILDVGTIKADQVWIDWLENLQAEVHATDYDEPLKPFNNITFHHADIRKLPLPDCFFDKIIAVSVIEHIGLEAPQVYANTVPKISNDGDLEAVTELARVLKPGGELIMTLPFGMQEGLILGNQARNYTIESIKKFESILDLVHIEYYEYQSKTFIFNAYEDRMCHRARFWIYEKINTLLEIFLENGRMHKCFESEIPGEVTWKNVPINQAKAIHKNHTEGILCGVWEKK